MSGRSVECARFGSLGEEEYTLDSLSVDLGDYTAPVVKVVHIGEGSHGTGKSEDCLVAGAAVELVRGILRGERKFDPEPWVIASGFCRACGKNVTCEVRTVKKKT